MSHQGVNPPTEEILAFKGQTYFVLLPFLFFAGNFYADFESPG